MSDALASCSIRPASVADAEAISRLVMTRAADVMSTPDAFVPSWFLDSLRPPATTQRLRSPSFRYFVAEDADGLAAVVALRERTHLYHLFVRTDLQRRGLARAIWTHARAAAGVDSFTVNAAPNAVTMYRRLGFASSGVELNVDGLVHVPMTLAPDC